MSCFLRTSQPTSEQNFLTHILGSSFCWSSVGFEPVTKCETSRSAQLLADLVPGWFITVVELLVSIWECESPMLLLQWWFLSSHPNQCSNRADTSTLTQHSSAKKKKKILRGGKMVFRAAANYFRLLNSFKLDHYLANVVQSFIVLTLRLLWYLIYDILLMPYN